MATGLPSNPLFAQGADWQLNACVNYGLNPWHLYSMGYRRAAELIFDYVATTHQDQDSLIYPLIFLWRHHLELTLKHIGMDAARLLDASWQPPRDHDLSSLFGTVRPLVVQCFEQYGEKVDNKNLVRMAAALAEFKKLDWQSMAFRYPDELEADESWKSGAHPEARDQPEHLLQLEVAVRRGDDE